MNSYCNGLYELSGFIGRRYPDADVMSCVIIMQLFFVLDIIVFFQINIPFFDQSDYKWVFALIAGFLLWLINYYVLGIRESTYTEYPPLSKGLTSLITLIYFAIAIGFLIHLVNNR